jgi:hypothetical protein
MPSQKWTKRIVATWPATAIQRSWTRRKRFFRLVLSLTEIVALPMRGTRAGRGLAPPDALDQLLAASRRLRRSAISVQMAPDRRYPPDEMTPSCSVRIKATSGAKPAPKSQARSEVSADPV